jgi:hypothetical protein
MEDQECTPDLLEGKSDERGWGREKLTQLFTFPRYNELPETLKFPNSFTDLAKVYVPPNDCCYENWSRIDPVRRMACPD